MKKKIAGILTGVLVIATMLAGCGSSSTNTERKDTAETTEAVTEEATEAPAETEAAEATEAPATEEKVEITLFAAKSLNKAMEDLIAKFNESYPNVTVTGSYDSSGTLMEQIQAGAACDVFFSAAQKQMDTLEGAGFVVDGTRKNVVNNQVCVVTPKDSGTTVTGLADLANAKSLAIADGSVPVGKYTRQALVNQGTLPASDDVSAITTQEISDALGGVEINECANVGAVTAAISEGSNEAGTIYYSDWYAYQDSIEILEVVSYDLTGNIIYPVAQINNEEASEAQSAAAVDFINFLKSDDAKAIFDEYKFDTNVE